MERTIDATQPMSSLRDCDVFSCPTQVLVIDAPGGPANILIDTLGRLLDRDLSVTSVDSAFDALRALDFYNFDIVMVGLDVNPLSQLSALPPVRAQAPERPILAVGRGLSARDRHVARTFGAEDVLALPERAVELKSLVQRMTREYLPHC